MPDIFISYSELDDRPFPHEEKGWISFFVNSLKNEVERRLEDRESCSLWMKAHALGRDNALNESEFHLQTAETMLIFLSKKWVETKTCRDELQLFKKYHPDLKGRIFLVVMTSNLQVEKLPEEISNLLGYQFCKKIEQGKEHVLGWPVPIAKDHLDYYYRLYDLAEDLGTTLNDRKTINLSNTNPHAYSQNTNLTITSSYTTKQPQKNHTNSDLVYIAPTSDELHDQRSELINQLKQDGIDSFPKGNSKVDDFDADLAQCSYFVQMLDVKNLCEKDLIIFEIARARGKSIVQWRDPNIDLQDLFLDDKQRSLLNESTVKARLIPEFAQLIKNLINAKKIPPPPTEQNWRKVLLDCGKEDLARTKALALKLHNARFEVSIARYDEEEPLNSIRHEYSLHKVLLIVHHSSKVQVITRYIKDFLEARSTAPNLLPILCRGEDVEPPSRLPRDCTILNCGEAFEPHCLEQFLQFMENPT